MNLSLPDEFRTNHRAASESLQRAVAYTTDDMQMIRYEIQKARYFEQEAMKHLQTPRQRALGIGLLHAVDLVEAVADAEFRPWTPPQR